MKIQSLLSFCQSNNFTEMHNAIRENANGYPYVTFINADNKAENIYFSVRASETVTAGQLITEDLLKSLQVATVTNAQGEERVKLCSKGESVRISIMEYLGK